MQQAPPRPAAPSVFPPHRWSAPYPPLAGKHPRHDWPPTLHLLWPACRAAWETVATLERAAAAHPFDADLWRLVNGAHATWLALEAYARPLLEAADAAASAHHT
jgi:hypothetical protein